MHAFRTMCLGFKVAQCIRIFCRVFKLTRCSLGVCLALCYSSLFFLFTWPLLSLHGYVFFVSHPVGYDTLQCK